MQKSEKKQAALPKEPVTKRVEENIEESKYFTPSGSARPQQPAQVKTEQKKEFDFPYSYGDNKIVLMVRDPHWMHSYWEITESKYNEIRSNWAGISTVRKRYLRVYDASKEPWKSFDIPVFHGARNWYINVRKRTGHTLSISDSLRRTAGSSAMARSNAVTTPRDGMCDVIDEEWMTIDFDRIYALSGGFGIGKSSGEIKKLMEKALNQQKASGWVSSMSSPFGGPAERPFFLVANTRTHSLRRDRTHCQAFCPGQERWI